MQGLKTFPFFLVCRIQLHCPSKVWKRIPRSLLLHEAHAKVVQSIYVIRPDSQRITKVHLGHLLLPELACCKAVVLV